MFAWRSFDVQLLMFPDFLLKNMNCASEAEESHSLMENLNHRESHWPWKPPFCCWAGNLAKHLTHTVYWLLPTMAGRCFYPHFAAVCSEVQKPPVPCLSLRIGKLGFQRVHPLSPEAAPHLGLSGTEPKVGAWDPCFLTLLPEDPQARGLLNASVSL